MDIKFPVLIEGILIKRLNRFLAEIKVHDKIALAHVPNSGRMQELLVPGARLMLAPHNKAYRKTAYDILLVDTIAGWVAIDSRLPNNILDVVLAKKKIKYFQDIVAWKREVTYKKSRFDFCLENNSGKIWVENKSVNLVIDGEARFPDAPTARGTRHIKELIELKKAGFRSVILFIVLREDAEHFTPNWQTDPEFSQALVLAQQNNVEAYAFKCCVNRQGITWGQEIPILLKE